MPTLTINEIECIHPKEAHDDEVYLVHYTEGSERLPRLWGPHTMEEGDRILLRDTIDPIEFHEYLNIILMEEDRAPTSFPIGDDDRIGYANRNLCRRF